MLNGRDAKKGGTDERKYLYIRHYGLGREA